MNLNLSQYSFLFEEKGNYYIFNSQTLFFSKISREFYNQLLNNEFEKFDSKTLEKLIEKKILLEEKDSSTCFNHLKTRHLASAYSTDTISLIVVPTTGCNFDCPYCFEPKKSPKVMSDQVMDRLIDYINKRSYADKISLTWYGGEPLLMIKKIQNLYHRIKNECNKEIIRNEIITNGYLLNQEVIEIFKDINIDKIQISLDGTQIHHDKTRFLRNGHKPTFKTIEENIKKLAIAIPELPISIRVNITKNNWHDFVELYHYYNKENWHNKIHLYPGYIREDDEENRKLCNHCFKNNELLDLYLKFAEEGVNVNLFPRNNFKGCMLQRANSYIVGPEGELYKCWNDVSNPEKIVGSIMHNNLVNYDLLMKYMQECSPVREDCRECRVYPICDGGCGYMVYRNKFENALYEVCTVYKDPNNLKKALVSSNKLRGINKGNKILNL